MIQGLDQSDLLPVSSGQATGGDIEVQSQAIRQLVRNLQSAQSTKPAVVGDQLSSGHPRFEPELTRKVAERTSHSNAVSMGVEPHDHRAATGRVKQIEQQADGRGLAGSIRTDEAEYLSRPDLQVEAVDAETAAVRLGEFLCLDSRLHRVQTITTGALSQDISSGRSGRKDRL